MIGELYSNQWKYIKLFILKFKASKKCSMIDDENEDEENKKIAIEIEWVGFDDNEEKKNKGDEWQKKKTTSSKENFPMVMKIKK